MAAVVLGIEFVLLLYPGSCLHKNQDFYDDLMSNLRGFHCVASPPTQEGKGVGNKRSKQCRGALGPLCSAQAWGRPASILPSTAADMQDSTSREGPRGRRACSEPCKLAQPQLEEQGERGVCIALTELLQSVRRDPAGLVRSQGILSPLIIEVRVPWPWGDQF